MNETILIIIKKNAALYVHLRTTELQNGNIRLNIC